MTREVQVVPTVNVSMPEALREFLEEQVERQGFSTISEYVRHLVRREMKRAEDSRLEELLLEGIQSGEAREMDASDWQMIRERVEEEYGQGSER